MMSCNVFSPDQYVASMEGNLPGWIQKILCLKAIRAGDVQAAALKLTETLKFGYFLHPEEVESALKCFLPQLMAEAVVSRETVGGVLHHLTEKKFYFSLAVLRLALQLAARLGQAQLNQMARRLYDDPSQAWLSGLDTDCSLTGVAWNLGAGASSALTKHFLLLLSADLLPWADQDKDQAVLYTITVGLQVSLVHSHWSRSYITALSLVQSFPSDAYASSLRP